MSLWKYQASCFLVFLLGLAIVAFVCQSEIWRRTSQFSSHLCRMKNWYSRVHNSTFPRFWHIFYHSLYPPLLFLLCLHRFHHQVSDIVSYNKEMQNDKHREIHRPKLQDVNVDAVAKVDCFINLSLVLENGETDHNETRYLPILGEVIRILNWVSSCVIWSKISRWVLRDNFFLSKKTTHQREVRYGCMSLRGLTFKNLQKF